jgi:multidrug efflux pump
VTRCWLRATNCLAWRGQCWRKFAPTVGRPSQLRLDIDRDKANALGVTFDAINASPCPPHWSKATSTTSNQGRLQRVFGDAPRAYGRFSAAAERGITPGVVSAAGAICLDPLGQGAAQTIPPGSCNHAHQLARTPPNSLPVLPLPRWRRLPLSCQPAFGYSGAVCRVRKNSLVNHHPVRVAILAVFLCRLRSTRLDIPLAVILVVPGVLGVLLVTLRVTQRHLLPGVVESPSLACRRRTRS